MAAVVGELLLLRVSIQRYRLVYEPLSVGDRCVLARSNSGQAQQSQQALLHVFH